MKGRFHITKARALKVGIALAIVGSTVAVAVACTPSSSNSSSTAATATTATKLGITTADATQVVTAEQWEALYPDEYSSMQLNANDDQTTSYLDENPFLATIYEGTPFSKAYDKARGHAYTITDVQASPRVGEKTKATCYACKGSYYPVAELEDTTGALYTTAFSAVDSSKLSAISCYDCHLNNPASATSSRQFFNDAFPNATIEWGASAAACGQCHNEYYFDSTTKAVELPAGITTAEDMLAYYDSIDFVDYTNPRTGVKQLKAQHPEVQNFAGSTHQMAGLTCADCHMERLTDENGNAYTSHEIVNPLESTVIQQTVCSKCHSNVDAQISAAQTLISNTEARETEVGTELETLTNKLADAVASGNYTEDELNKVRSLNRSAMWYWDYQFVENSNGFHNPEASTSNLNKAEELCNQALALLNK